MSDEKPPVKSYCGGKPNYCTPEEVPKREWVGLTEVEIYELMNFDNYEDLFDFAEAIEAKLKEKNT